jgi:protein-tyrosine phosphatase|tara:strand:- start:579 stop:1322 length:744 start_codon:yes stop_codon:yes gene_type:complete
MVDETLHPKRVLDIASAENVRDLGGYSTEDGGSTQWGRIVRSADMDRLTTSDQQKLIDYGIGTVIDLRMQREVARMPNVFSDSSRVSFHNHDFWGDRFEDYRSKDRAAPAEAKLADLYCEGLVASGFVMADIMQTIAASDRDGVIYHCRSGKDRTGLVSALLLSIAGVRTETICADYALTSQLLTTADPNNQIKPGERGYYLQGCAAETMERTLDFLATEFSGVPGYLGSLGVEDAQLARIRQKLCD